MDALEFLAGTSPFDVLTAEERRRLVDTIDVTYHPAGELLFRRGDPIDWVGVIRSGVVHLGRDVRDPLVLEHGDALGFPAVLVGGGASADAVVVEDLLLYRIPADRFRSLLGDADVARHFTHGLAERLRALRNGSGRDTDWHLPVEHLGAGSVVRVPASASIREAATTMRDRGVSCLVVDGDELGIVTDRDLRNRVVAEGLDTSAAVATIASVPARTIPVGTLAFQAMLTMVEQGIHHLPIERDGELVGIVTNTDLLRERSVAPSLMLSRLRRTSDVGELVGHADALRDTVAHLFDAGLDGHRIARVATALNDAAVQASLRIAEDELGAPPAAYAFLVLGSAGRYEQALLTDQDNALVFGASDDPKVEDYMRRLADRTVALLLRAGFPECPGGYMATNWHGTLATWERRIRDWTTDTDADALLRLSLFQDHRVVAGDLDVSSFEKLLHEIGRDGVLLARMAKVAVGWRPPLSPLRRISEGPEGLDLKQAAIVPIVLLARVVAMEAGATATDTIARLHTAGEPGDGLSPDGAEIMSEAYRFLLTLRLRAQLAAIDRGEAPTNRIHLDDLSSLERRHLRDVFVAIRDVQHATEQRLLTSTMGRG